MANKYPARSSKNQEVKIKKTRLEVKKLNGLNDAKCLVSLHHLTHLTF
jgi:hypothetical protein